MTTKLYHRDVYLPEHLEQQVPKTVISFKYSRHARYAAENDRYGRIPLMESIDLSEIEIFELESINDQVIKVAFRAYFNEKFDICFAMNLDGFVRTVWLNRGNDTHKTLEKSKYATAT